MPEWVGLKYCGGCTPRFDRVAVVERLRNIVSGHVRFVPYKAECPGQGINDSLVTRKGRESSGSKHG